MGTGFASRDDTPGADKPGITDVLSVVLPSVLKGLAADQPQTRVSAAWTACRLADNRPDLGAELATRLVRSANETHREALVRTLASLHERHPEKVGNALRAFDGTVVRAVRKASSWDFESRLRADGGAQAMTTNQRVIEAESSGVTVHQRQLPDEPEPPDRSREREPPTSRESDNENETEERQRQIQAAENSEAFAAIQLVSEFDDVSVVDPPERGRYGLVLPAHARIDQVEHGFDLLFFDEPDEESRAFGSAVHKCLHQWYSADEATGIAAVADYGDHPRPWAATPRVETTLAEQTHADIETALRDARELAAGLAAVNERGMVHGGIDPHDIVYPAIGFESNPSPSLAHIGIMTVFRQYFQPAEYVDPRYAAPEYFDDRFGSIDHATDIYHLGAIMFRLFTGEPPYDGEYEMVRESILSGSVPVPSEVRSTVPAVIDEIVAKAMAPRKLTRFETATQLHRQLKKVTLGDAHGDRRSADSDAVENSP